MPSELTRWNVRHEEQRMTALSEAQATIANARQQVKILNELKHSVTGYEAKLMISDALAIAQAQLASAQAIARAMEAAGRGR